jgi:hypothetical protein
MIESAPLIAVAFALMTAVAFRVRDTCALLSPRLHMAGGGIAALALLMCAHSFAQW